MDSFASIPGTALTPTVSLARRTAAPVRTHQQLCFSFAGRTCVSPESGLAEGFPRASGSTDWPAAGGWGNPTPAAACQGRDGPGHGHHREDGKNLCMLSTTQDLTRGFRARCVSWPCIGQWRQSFMMGVSKSFAICSKRLTLLWRCIPATCHFTVLLSCHNSVYPSSRHQHGGLLQAHPNTTQRLPPCCCQVSALVPRDQRPKHATPPRFTVAAPIAGPRGQRFDGRSRGPCRGRERSRFGGSGGVLCEGAFVPGGGGSRRAADREQAA